MNNLKIVNIIDPNLCVDCRFNIVVDVNLEGETTRRMMHCTRKDCDNWENTIAPKVTKVFFPES